MLRAVQSSSPLFKHDNLEKELVHYHARAYTTPQPPHFSRRSFGLFSSVVRTTRQSLIFGYIFLQICFSFFLLSSSYLLHKHLNSQLLLHNPKSRSFDLFEILNTCYNQIALIITYITSCHILKNTTQTTDCAYLYWLGIGICHL